MVRQTKHIFLDLPKLSGDLQAYIDRTSTLGGWSSNCVQVGARCYVRGCGLACLSFALPAPGTASLPRPACLARGLICVIPGLWPSLSATTVGMAICELISDQGSTSTYQP